MEDKWFYQYHLKWYMDWEDKEIEEEGIVQATDYSDACAQLEEAYGKEAIIGIYYLCPIGDFLDRETVERIKWRVDFTELDDCDQCKI